MTDREMTQDRVTAQTQDDDSIEEGENPVMSGIRHEDELLGDSRVGDEARIGDEEAQRDPAVEGAPVGPSAGVVGTPRVFADPTPPAPGSAAEQEPEESELRRRTD